MDDDLVDREVERLVAAHPALFGGALPEAFSHLPPGWYNLVDRLCHALEERLGEQAWRRLQVLQLKEKYGALRFHYRFVADEAPQRPSEPSLHVEKPRPSEECRASVKALVGAATAESTVTCLRCGESGVLRNIDGYLTTLCTRHHTVAAGASKAGSR